MRASPLPLQWRLSSSTSILGVANEREEKPNQRVRYFAILCPVFDHAGIRVHVDDDHVSVCGDLL